MAVEKLTIEDIYSAQVDFACLVTQLLSSVVVDRCPQIVNVRDVLRRMEKELEAATKKAAKK